MDVLSFTNLTLASLPDAAAKIAAVLAPEGWFYVAVHGEMGVGKTTFSGHVLHALGVPEDQPVTSPTFTYLNEYTTGAGRLLAHLDMYRAEISMSLEDLGASDQRSFWGILVEWPERLTEPLPTHVLTIEYTRDPAARNVRFSRI